MDTTRARDIVKQVIQRYAQFKPSRGDIRLDTVFDDTQNRYALMQVGWDRGRRARHPSAAIVCPLWHERFLVGYQVYYDCVSWRRLR